MLGLGLGFTAWLVLRIGPGQIQAGFSRVGAKILWLFVAYAAGTAIGAFPWWGLLPRHARPSCPAAVASRFVASGANVIVPLFGLGGEPLRLLWLSPRDRPRGIAAIVIDRVTYSASGAIFSLAGVAALLSIGRLDRVYALVAATVSLGTLAVVAVLLWLTARHRVAGRLAEILHHLFAKKIPESGLDGSGHEVDRVLTEMLEGPKGPIALALLVHVASRFALGAEVYVGLLALGAGSQPAVALVLASVPVLVSPFTSWIPAQAGVQEGSTAAVAAALGLSPATGVTLVLLQRIRQLFFVGLATVLASSARARATPEESEPTGADGSRSLPARRPLERRAPSTDGAITPDLATPRRRRRGGRGLRAPGLRGIVAPVRKV